MGPWTVVEMLVMAYTADPKEAFGTKMRSCLLEALCRIGLVTPCNFEHLCLQHAAEEHAEIMQYRLNN